MIKIAQASSSENFGKYGTAPNQRRTGVTAAKPQGNLDGELNIVNWYGGWSRVYRPIDGEVAEKIAQFFYKAVANGSHVGYSWGSTQLFDAMKKLGTWDPMDLTTLVNCDCCTLLGAAVEAAGLHDDALRALCTWQVEEVFARLDAFQVLESRELCQEGIGIRRGDILWKSGHVACSMVSDTSAPRLSLTDKGLFFADPEGNVTASYPEDGAKLLRENGLRTVQMSGNSWYTYSSKGAASYTLASDAVYLVLCVQRNAKISGNGAAWIVSANKQNSNMFALKSSSTTKAVVNGLELQIARGCDYALVAIIRLS